MVTETGTLGGANGEGLGRSRCTTLTHLPGMEAMPTAPPGVDRHKAARSKLVGRLNDGDGRLPHTDSHTEKSHKRTAAMWPY